MSKPDLQGAYRDRERAIETELTRIGLDIEAAAVKYLQKHDINVTGDLVKSIRSEVQRITNGFELRVGTNMQYAPFRHFDTQPHWVPRKPILRWVQKKLGLQGKELRQRTFLVQRKIALRGTKGKPFLTAPFRLFRNQIGRRIAQAVSSVS